MLYWWNTWNTLYACKLSKCMITMRIHRWHCWILHDVCVDMRDADTYCRNRRELCLCDGQRMIETVGLLAGTHWNTYNGDHWRRWSYIAFWIIFVPQTKYIRNITKIHMINSIKLSGLLLPSIRAELMVLNIHLSCLRNARYSSHIPSINFHRRSSFGSNQSKSYFLFVGNFTR